MYCAWESPSVFGVFFSFLHFDIFFLSLIFLTNIFYMIYADRKQQIGLDTLTYSVGFLAGNLLSVLLPLNELSKLEIVFL